MGPREVIHIDDVPVDEVWAHLKSNPKAVLVDVRTRAEWVFVGLPDLTELSKKVLTVEWQTFPDNRVDDAFTERMTKVLKATGATPESDLYFICRSGSRSRMAAEAMALVGFKRCHNVADGFEGPLDASRHRGRVAGWKAAGLPWAQG